MSITSFQKNTIAATALACTMAFGGAVQAENDNAAAEPVTPSFTPAEKKANADAVYECVEPELSALTKRLFSGADSAQAATDMTRLIGECVDQSVPGVTMPPAPVASEAIKNGTASWEDLMDHMEAINEYESFANAYIDSPYLGKKIENKINDLTLQHLGH